MLFVVQGGEDQPPKADRNAPTSYAEKATMARAVIVNGLKNEPLKVTRKANSPKEMWD